MLGSGPEWTKAAVGAGAVAVKSSSAESGSLYPVYKAGPGPHLRVLFGQHGELRGVPCLRWQSEGRGRSVSGEGDAADEELRPVGKGNADMGKTHPRVMGPGCPS